MSDNRPEISTKAVLTVVKSAVTSRSFFSIEKRDVSVSYTFCNSSPVPA